MYSFDDAIMMLDTIGSDFENIAAATVADCIDLAGIVVSQKHPHVVSGVRPFTPVYLQRVPASCLWPFGNTYLGQSKEKKSTLTSN